MVSLPTLDLDCPEHPDKVGLDRFGLPSSVTSFVTPLKVFVAVSVHDSHDSHESVFDDDNDTNLFSPLLFVNAVLLLVLDFAPAAQGAGLRPGPRIGSRSNTIARRMRTRVPCPRPDPSNPLFASSCTISELLLWTTESP